MVTQTKAQLIKYLKKCKNNSDKEAAHQYADIALLEFINDKKITEAFNKIDKWYA